MKKYQIVLLVVALLVILLCACFVMLGPTGSIASAKDKRILLNSFSILSDINLGEDCRYLGPSRSWGVHNPGFECLGQNWFKEEDQEKEIIKIKQILEDSGWKPSSNNYLHKTEVTYYKDNFVLIVETNKWDSNRKDEQYRLLGYFSLMTLDRLDWDKR
jgi:hypothetical protein